MTIRWGVSPIAWVNDDMPELGRGTTVEQILDDAQAIGFAGIEIGNAFPRDPDRLASILSRRRLSLIGGWYGTGLLIRSAEAEIAAMGPHLDLLAKMGSDVCILAETSNAIHGNRTQPLARPPRLRGADWVRFGDRLDAVADHLAGRGFRLAYHHHLGTVVESDADLRALFATTTERVGLTIDTGHAVLGGIDPAAVVRQHPRRIVHVHCKDVRAARHAAIRRSGGSFLDGVVAGMFTVPGDGDLDFKPFLAALAANGYAGWIVVEAEQDPAVASPRQYQQLGLDTLRRLAAAAGMSS